MSEITTIGVLEPKIFATLETLNPNRKIFLVDTGVNLDSIYWYRYSDRRLKDDIDIDKVAGFLEKIYGDTWDSAYNLITAGNNLMLDFGNLQSETITRENQYTDTTSEDNNTVAFDVQDPQLDTQLVSEFNHTTLVDKETRLVDNKDMSKFYDSWNYLKNNWLDDIVFQDVNNFITLKVHY